MSYELIITEKPAASKRIADALADGKALKQNNKGVPYYSITHGKQDIIVACAVGHLFGLGQKEGTKKTYPVFDVEWKPSYEINKESKFTKKYYDTLKKLSKKADNFTIATDYDVEGEVIGYNCLRFLCKQKDASRMKFSTLTKPDIDKAYDQKSKTINWGQAKAGEARHILDWFYGINLSRALTQAVKTTGRFKLLSAGRVQGPALKIIVEREKEIQAFNPVPFWQLELIGEVRHEKIIAMHKEDKFWEKEKAEQILEKTKGKEAIVDDVNRSEFKQAPPTPFDLTTLQTESYKCLGFSPKMTLQVAQELYISGLISYPRTSSQKLPPSINYSKIIADISKQTFYTAHCKELLKKSLSPNEGKKSDPAHPAIYPTGIISHIDGDKAKLYDLIVRRFLSTFGEPAVRETMTITIVIESEPFISKGTRTVKKGWHEYYGPHVKLKDEELPNLEKGEAVEVKELNMLDKETSPPKRYTPASIIRELEKKNLGTKATRSQIVDTLFNRGYVKDKSIIATDLGIKTVETLEKYSPKILDENMTRSFEEEMDEIREKKQGVQHILDKARNILEKILKEFKDKEKEIGEALYEANQATQKEISTVGKCPNCENGELVLRKGKFGRFIACNNHPECNTTFNVPKTGGIKTLKETCDACSMPLVSIIKARKRPQQVCINPNCPNKKIEDEHIRKSVEDIEKGVAEKKCPKCGSNLVVRKSIYGQFYGCSKYPKCRHTERIDNSN